MNSFTLYNVIDDVKAKMPECLTSIQCGDKYNDRIAGSISDSTSDNIAHKYPSHLGLTSQYWIWKNDTTSEYVGIFMDSRFLSLTNNASDLYTEIGTLDALKSYGYDSNIHEKLPQHDLFIPKIDKGIGKSNYEIYETAHVSSDLDLILKIIQLKYPNQFERVREYIYSSQGYYSYSFIMKKNIFDEYSSWLFSILDEYEALRSISIESKDKQAPRHLAERLLGAYISILAESEKYNIAECPILIIRNDKPLHIEPIFETTDCAVVVSSSDEYAPYFSAMLESIIEHSESSKNYDIVVLTKYISAKKKKLILSQIKAHSNFSVRFFDISGLIEDYKSLPTHNNIEIETYFRYFIPTIMEKYDKVVYLDCDITVLSDLAKLYSETVDDNYLLATIDADFAGCYNHIDGRKEYIDMELQIKKPYEYFQSGVMLLNLSKFRLELPPEKLLEFSGKQHWIHLDQDVLNYFCQGKVKIIDMSWDVLYDFRDWRSYIIPFAPQYIHEMYLNARKSPKIVHYAGQDKPWYHPDVDYAEYFWQFARKSPFYEWLVFDLARHTHDE